MKIGLDCDDVKVPFIPSFLNFINEDAGSDFKLEDMDTWNIESCKKIKEKVQESRHPEKLTPGWSDRYLIEFADKGYYASMPLIYGISEVVAFLKNRNHDLHAVTNRIKAHSGVSVEHKNLVIEHTLIWYSMHLNRYFNRKNIHFVELGEDKGDYCARKGIDILVEDNADSVVRFLKANPKGCAIIIDYPYNRTTQSNGKLIRVSGDTERKKYENLRSALEALTTS